MADLKQPMIPNDVVKEYHGYEAYKGKLAKCLKPSFPIQLTLRFKCGPTGYPA